MTHSSGAPILRRLTPGDADPILVADFQAMSMAPRLSEMLAERVDGRAVFQIDPIGMLSEQRLHIPLPELAAACADEFAKSGADHGRVLVAGHCSAAPLALRVAGLLAPSRDVTAVLVNPTWPDDDHVAAKLAEFLSKFGPVSQVAPVLDADPTEVVATLERALVEEVTALAAARGLDSSAGAFTDLVLWYRAWLSFLLAGRNDTENGTAVGAGRVTVLSDSPSTLAVPGLSADAYAVRELPTQPVGSVTPELAGIVAEHVAQGNAADAAV
jgi:hypothetical protein